MTNASGNQSRKAVPLTGEGRQGGKACKEGNERRRGLALWGQAERRLEGGHAQESGD